MAKGLSEDLRLRVISAVESGMSCRGAAARFGVSASSAVRWVREWRESGRTAPRRQGGDRLSGRIEAHADFLLAEIEAAPDRTLEELRTLLARERGIRVSNSTVWRFCRRHGLTTKKRPVTPTSRTATTFGRRAKPGSRPSRSSTRRG
jgi:transposase